jgi:nucleoside-diphosphate-sugar epimerase
MKKNFLIFGKSNLIASKTISFLKKKNYVKSYSSKECNLLNQKDVNKVLKYLKKKYNLIIFSSITKNKNSNNNFLKNLKMIQNITPFLNTKKIAKVIYISSVEVYGENPDLPITEKTLINPRNLYGLAKFVSEQYLRLEVERKKLLVLRLPGYYGYGDMYQSVIGKFIKSATCNKKILINSSGSELRDFLFVNDFPVILNNLINQNIYGIINIVSGHSSSILSIAKYISKLVKKIKIYNKKKTKKYSQYIFLKNQKFKDKSLYKFTNFKVGIKNYLDYV